MKHSILILAITMMVTVATAQQQYEPISSLSQPGTAPAFGAVVTSSGDSAFILEIDNPSKTKLTVWVRHAILGTVTDTVVQEEKYSCRFNLTHADEGNYLVTVSNGKSKVTRKIEYLSTLVTQRRIVLQ